MKKIFVQPVDKLVGKTEIPGDKSISHRSIMLGALADGKTTVKHFLLSDDCLNTIECFKELGVNIEVTGDEVVIHGQGIDGLKEPNDILEVGNSGTTMRLMAGILAGQSFASVLTGDATIRRRPMARVTEPLKLMGANIIGREQGNLAPLTIQGGSLKGIEYHSSVASAQVKSAILLAGLFADGWTEVKEPAKSRNHTELMLKGFQVELEESDLAVRIKGRQRLSPCDIYVPGDISSAAFLLVAGCLVPDSELTLLNVGLNHTRTGIIDVLSEMGARIEIRNRWNSGGEELGDLVVSTSSLKGVRIGGELIPRLIDEIPIIAIAAGLRFGSN